MIVTGGGQLPRMMQLVIDIAGTASLVLAVVGAILALRSRCEGWITLLAGCALFIVSDTAMLELTGSLGAALLMMAAAIVALTPLARMPISYWRVAG